MKHSNFVFVTPAFNCEKTIQQTILSVVAQSYPHWRMVIYDDMSTDTTSSSVNNIAKVLGMEDRLSVVSRSEKYGEVRNTIDAVSSIDDNEIVCRLDGGDWLTDNDTLAVLHQMYSTHDPAVLWTKHRWAYTSHNISGPLNTPDADVYKHPWVSSHLKTFRKNAINDINQSNFKDENGDWIMIGCDQAIFLPILHKAGLENRPRLFLPMVCYHYSIDLEDTTLFSSERSVKQKHSAEWVRDRGYIG